jgi:hypothetical protein
MSRIGTQHDVLEIESVNMLHIIYAPAHKIIGHISVRRVLKDLKYLNGIVY